MQGNVSLFFALVCEYTASPAVSHLQQVSTPSLARWPLPLGQEGVVAVETWEYCHERKKSSRKKESEVSAFLTYPSFVLLLTSRHPLFSPFLSELNSHILALSIYLYSHLFTFLFKIFVYKCVYKLNIISSCPVSKWHLQGKGCVGLRFLIALQEPTKRQHRTLSKCVWDWFWADEWVQPKLWVIYVCFCISEKSLTHDLGP